MDSPYLGQIQTFAFNFATRGWSLCNGQIISISQNTALFSLLGTYFGGNGQSTFQLPDFQGRVAIGFGSGAGLPVYAFGQKGGNATVTLTQAQMPIHNHTAVFTPSGGGSGTPTVTVTPQLLVSTGNGTQSAASAAVKTLAGVGSDDGSGNFVSGYGYNNTTGTVAVNGLSATATISGVGGSGGTIVVANAGGSQPVNIETPYVAVNYSIALTGIFPSRN